MPLLLESAVLAVTALLALLSTINVASIVLSRRRRRRGGSNRVGPEELEFVIVSKASRQVIETLVATVEEVRKRFPEYRIWIVVDEGSYGIPVLRSIAGKLGFELVVVSSDYDKGRFKARAMNYFIENYVEDEKWYVFLDDDSYPLDDRFLYEIREEIPVYNGILAPRRGRGLIPWLADSVRYYSDVTRARFALETLRKPIYGLHGELLIVKGWVLTMIGFNTDSLTEDSWFAARLIERGIPVGQVSTRVSIQSPPTIRDFMVQRSRWFLGRLRDFLRGEYPALMMLAYLLELLFMLLFPLIHLVVALKVAYNIEFKGSLAIVESWVRYAGLPLLATAYTLYHAIERRNPLAALATVALLPVITVIEAHTVTYAFKNYKRLKGNFIVVNKDLASQAGSREEIREMEEVEPSLLPHLKPEGETLTPPFSIVIAGEISPWMLEGGVKPFVKVKSVQELTLPEARI